MRPWAAALPLLILAAPLWALPPKKPKISLCKDPRQLVYDCFEVPKQPRFSLQIAHCQNGDFAEALKAGKGGRMEVAGSVPIHFTPAYSIVPEMWESDEGPKNPFALIINWRAPPTKGAFPAQITGPKVAENGLLVQAYPNDMLCKVIESRQEQAKKAKAKKKSVRR